MLRSLALAIVCLALPSIAAGVPIVYTATLDGPSESPPVPSSGTGSAVVTYHPEAQTLAVDISFSGLTGTTTTAHIHCCTLPTAGVATATPTFPGFPAGVMAGTYDEVFDLTDASSWNAAFITANGGTVDGAVAALAAGLAAGVAYVNIHSTFATGGEIRGFLVPVPEPTTATLVGAGAALLALSRRRARVQRLARTESAGA